MSYPAPRLTLRDLPVPARLVISIFLLSVGIGYFSALIQLHFQFASPGNLLPAPEDAVVAYHGRPALSQLERVLVADETRPFNGSGSMRSAFTTRSGGRWQRIIDKKAKDKGLDDAKNDEQKRRILMQAEMEVRGERDGERLAILDWIHQGHTKEGYEKGHPLPPELAKHAISEEFVETGPDGGKIAKIVEIFERRCVRCHAEGKSDSAGQYPLDSFEHIEDYLAIETTGGGMSLKKLAQTTHVHLLGFSMLYGLTGFIFAFTSYPVWLRVLIAPGALLMQIIDIGCWWLGRMDPFFAELIVLTGGAVGMALFLQIVLSLFSMFGKTGRIVLILVLLAGTAGEYVVYRGVIAPYLAKEALSSRAPE